MARTELATPPPMNDPDETTCSLARYLGRSTPVGHGSSLDFLLVMVTVTPHTMVVVVVVVMVMVVVVDVLGGCTASVGSCVCAERVGGDNGESEKTRPSPTYPYGGSIWEKLFYCSGRVVVVVVIFVLVETIRSEPHSIRQLAS